MSFLVEVLVGGLLAGVMYAMVAIGFVLIYRASGVFNFAQGSMVLLSALTFVCLVERGLHPVLSFLVTLGTMVLLAFVIERQVLRPLVNQPPLALFMATLGLSFVLDGAAQTIWGTQVHGLDLGISDEPLEIAGVMVGKLDLIAAGTAAALVALLSVVFGKTRLGIALRAVADDQLAAVAVGLSLPRIWRSVWAVAGMVALVAGLLWGARGGVQFSLSLIVLRALPVLIIGGFSSINGTIVGGLLVGATEKLAEVYVGPHLGGGIETWFTYVFALGFLMFKPTGLFGEQAVERV